MSQDSSYVLELLPYLRTHPKSKDSSHELELPMCCDLNMLTVVRQQMNTDVASHNEQLLSVKDFGVVVLGGCHVIVGCLDKV